MYLRIPDKSVVDKQAKEAFDYFVTLWKEYLNAQMIERYSQEIVADYQKGVQEQAMWANLKSSGKLPRRNSSGPEQIAKRKEEGAGVEGAG